MNITDLHVPVIFVGTAVVATVKVVSSFNKVKQDTLNKLSEQEYANDTLRKDLADLKEDFNYISNALDKKIEHRDKRLSGSIIQIQNYLEKHGSFIRRDPLYDGGSN